MYGLLAAHPVAPLVSLHHLDYVQPLFPTGSQVEALKSLMGAYEADPGRTLQQSFCYDLERKWSVSVAWGYTAQIYPFLMTANILETPEQTFQTWRSRSDGPFTFNTRPMSPDPCERPLVYFLDRVEWLEGGATLTSYKRSEAGPGKDCGRAHYGPALAVNSIKVSAPRMDSDEWKKVKYHLFYFYLWVLQRMVMIQT